MCGRTACTLGPDEVCRSCSVRTVGKDGKKQYQAPQWRDHPGDHTYRPSTNIAPTRYTPVMISEHHVRGVKRENEGSELPSQCIIQPMLWGLIPPFYKGENATGHGYSTTNCRLEDIEEKKSYKPSLVKGQRCVVLCDGFYEWQSTKGNKNKQPYFIHAPQPEGVKIWDRSTWDVKGVWSEEEGWKGPKLLKMAGIFSIWMSAEGGEVMSYSVVTKASEGKFTSLHHRVPAILNTDQEVQDWLDFGHVNYRTALSHLAKGQPDLEWYPVSTQVNNSRNQEPELNHPIDLDKKPPQSASSQLMSNWLKMGSGRVKKEEKSGNIKEKEVKKENGKDDEVKEENVKEEPGSSDK